MSGVADGGTKAPDDGAADAAGLGLVDAAGGADGNLGVGAPPGPRFAPKRLRPITPAIAIAATTRAKPTIRGIEVLHANGIGRLCPAVRVETRMDRRVCSGR
jgi:hypothetical protein